MNSLLSCAELHPAVLLALILPGQTMAESPALKPDSQSQVQSNQLACALIGKWTLDVQATADVLARGRFGSRKQVTIKMGAAHPETNVIHTPSDQKQYEEIRELWVTNLAKMKVQYVFSPDGTCESSVCDPETNKRASDTLKWTLNGSELRVEHPNARRPRTDTAKLVSTNELRYPMQPLGGWLVLRPERRTDSHR